MSRVEVGGVDEKWQTTITHGIIVEIEGTEVPTSVDCRPETEETILGRDVLNNFTITLRGKELEFIVDDC